MMVVELKPQEFPAVLPLYRSMNVSFPLISAVIQQQQRGQIFVDQSGNPKAALVVTAFGFISYLAFGQNRIFDDELSQLFASTGAFKPAYLLWYSPHENWQEKLNTLGSNLVRRRERIRFEFRPERADYLSQAGNYPSTFQLRDLDAELIQKTEKFGLNIDSRFWSSAADFSQNGMGICLLVEGEVLSLCYAAAIVDGLAEVDVVTAPEHRGQGLAVIVTQQFIRKCLSSNILPTWDCFADNHGSLRLARRLGFIEVNNYSFYSFNVPLKIEAD
jgi:RimJ/RimL family protein N-acetyltransferase